MAECYDAIVIGARCGGAPTAMLLARKGYRVLMVDRATFPSDTVSTHFDPRTRRGGAGTVGSPRRAGGDRAVPPVRIVQLRLRTVHDRRGHRGRSTASTRPTARAVPCSTRCWSTRQPTPVSRCARRSRSTTSSSRTEP